MARYTGADCKLCRREKMKLFLKGAKCDSPKCPIEIRPYPPGEHGRNRPKESEYLLQIREKQKARRIYGSLQMTVAIKADGEVEGVEINRSSGHKVLDQAAIRIVRLASPFDRFPANIKADTDILHITRTWTFTKGDELRSE